MKKTINIEAPAAIGPYSHANTANGFVFTSGQLGISPKTGKLEDGVIAQTNQAMENLQKVLTAAGCGLEDVVKTTIFVTDMGNFAVVNEVYKKYFCTDCPARSCVQVSALPAGGLVEIEAVAAFA